MQRPSEVSVRFLKGIGPKRAEKFAALGVNTVEDLCYFFPRRYQDRTRIARIFALQEGETATVRAEVVVSRSRQAFRRRRFSMVEAVFKDATGRLNAVWFNQPYLKDQFKAGMDVFLYGKVERYAGKLQMTNPEFEVIDGQADAGQQAGTFVPVYSLPAGIPQRYFRSLMHTVLDSYVGKLGEFVPYDIRQRNNLLNLPQSLRQIHFPDDLGLQQQAYRRLAFEEFLLFQLPLAMRKLRRKEKQGIAHALPSALADGFIRSLPFRLTAGQSRALAEIQADMARPQPMQRLLQGDVGSGKTVVATAAALTAVQGGYQAALMVPTEILARQHYAKITAQLKSLPAAKGVKTVMISAAMKKETRQKLAQEISAGSADIVIGTHALLQEQVAFKSLGLVIIDEQHKFGVGQRALLPQKGPSPDVLIMTATPIPRTLAITLYGDMDVSLIEELPVGRIAVQTRQVTRDFVCQAYDLAREEIRKGRQVFVVYPVIEESYALDIAGAKTMYEELRNGEFRECRVGLIHGKLSQAQQEETMRQFKEHNLDLLVSTTILEVGIDIPNATCMIIEHAERFGLSQLHQLRGRVGRGSEQSYCLLVSDAQTEDARARMQAMVSHSSGFKIAEEDLKIRGPGEFFGSRQHGLTELRIGNPLTQLQLLKRAREEALLLLETDPALQQHPHQLLREKLLQRFPEYENLMLVA